MYCLSLAIFIIVLFVFLPGLVIVKKFQLGFIQISGSRTRGKGEGTIWGDGGTRFPLEEAKALLNYVQITLVQSFVGFALFLGLTCFAYFGFFGVQNDRKYQLYQVNIQMHEITLMGRGVSLPPNLSLPFDPGVLILYLTSVIFFRLPFFIWMIVIYVSITILIAYHKNVCYAMLISNCLFLCVICNVNSSRCLQKIIYGIIFYWGQIGVQFCFSL
eukprot:TRINITY_DN9162_c1_g1_i8.p5 TRINITY_DN9162_c1_g1~~TRINITY_DN9162_c1_g1_i8.p5  ORF type:complete len:216 (-),score=-10.09 TRINITY_DN9162_c1_g1_i8:126-773(-)